MTNLHPLVKSFTIILLFLFPAIGLAQTLQLNRANLTNIVQTWQLQHQIPAVTLYVQTPTQRTTILSGTTRLNGKTSVTADTLFGVGSITKTLVSAVILKLAAEKKLSLNDRLGKFLSQYPKWQDITLKQLLNMTSGIPNATENPAVEKRLDYSPEPGYTPDKLINIAYHEPVKFAPGKGWYYSNTSYFLLGKVIEKVTGKSLETVFQNRLFKPLGMTHSIFSNSHYTAEQIRHMAHGYYNTVDRTYTKPGNYGAAGAAFMSIGDLATWANALFVKQKLLDKPQLKQMLTFVPVAYRDPRPKHTYYGLGIFKFNLPPYGKMISYTGVIRGYSSAFIWLPNSHVLVAAQINRWQGNNFDLLFPNKALFDSILHAIFAVKKKKTKQMNS
jgi:D-alanyl-D-alanine carboxypeptidase